MRSMLTVTLALLLTCAAAGCSDGVTGPPEDTPAADVSVSPGSPDAGIKDPLEPDQGLPLDSALPDSGATAPDAGAPQHWALGLGGAETDSGYRVAVDYLGHVIVAGVFRDRATFGSKSVTATGKPKTSDIFVAKINPQGQVVWVVAAGGYESDEVGGLATDGKGGIYIAGRIRAIGNFGNYTVRPSGTSDLYLAKLNPYGVFQWARGIGGYGTERMGALASDSAGNVYLSGTYGSKFTVGSVTVGATYPSGEFVLKLDSSGSAQWAAEAFGMMVSTGLAVDSKGGVMLAAYYRGGAKFGTLAISANSSSYWEAVVARLDAKGSFEWARGFGGDDSVYARSIVLDGSGGSYLVGYFREGATFGSTKLSARAGAGDDDIFVVKLDSKGAVVWAKRFGGLQGDNCYGGVLGKGGDLYVVGNFTDDITLAGKTLHAAGGLRDTDTVWFRLGSDGTVKEAASGGSANRDLGFDIAVDAKGAPYLVGAYSGSATFGSTTLTSNGGDDAFVWRAVK